LYIQPLLVTTLCKAFTVSAKQGNLNPVETDFIPYHAVAHLPARHALVLAPHPDDEVFGCGGAILAHVQRGIPVSVIILTDGSLYGDAAIRTAESRSAATLLGCGEPEFWAYPDRGLRHDQELVARLVQKIVATGTDVVYAPSPWEVHPDHRQTASAATQAVLLTGVRIAYYEVGSPLRPNLLLDITAHAAAKMRAMQCFTSQMEQQDYARHIAALNQYRTYTLPREVTAAEAYLLLSAAELIATLPSLLVEQPLTLGSTPTSSAASESLPLASVLMRSMDRQHLQETLDSVAVQTLQPMQKMRSRDDVELHQLMEQQLADKEQQRAKAVLESERLMSDIVKIKASRSWRVTAPLRWLYARIQSKD
jgi:LmbE family N-acetylglucosaminyl deacetylase